MGMETEAEIYTLAIDKMKENKGKFSIMFLILAFVKIAS